MNGSEQALLDKKLYNTCISESMEYFDWHQWKPKLYKTPEELNAALHSLGVLEKEIQAVHVLGAALSFHADNALLQVRRTLAQVGIPYEDIDNGSFPLDSTLIPQKVELCEPVVILFSDGSTLDLMPLAAEGMLMSANQIPPDILDGTNHSDFHSNEFFSCLHGRKIRSIETIRQKITHWGSSSSYSEVREYITFQFDLEGKNHDNEYGFAFRQLYWHGWKGSFSFSVTQQYHHSNLGYETAAVPYSSVKAASKHLHQVIIYEGQESGGSFSVMPVKLSSDEPNGTISYHEEEISIFEDDISAFLYYFLQKYFDDSYPYDDLRYPEDGPGFEWYSSYNFYSYTIMADMLREIEACAELLTHDYDNPGLLELKSRFHWHQFVSDDSTRMSNPSAQEASRIIKDNIHVAADFYQRFVRRVRAMMENAPQFELITFAGP